MQKPKVLVIAGDRKTQSAVTSALKDIAVILISGAAPEALVAEYTENAPSVVIVAVSTLCFGFEKWFQAVNLQQGM